MSIVLQGSTSGSITLQEPAVAGTSVLALPVGSGTVVANNVNSAIVSGTAVASTSGTSINFTGIPSWVKRITVMLNGVSTSGTSQMMIQLGDAGGIETSGYLGTAMSNVNGSATANHSSGFLLNPATDITAEGIRHGSFIITNITSNTWTMFGIAGFSNTPFNAQSSGSKGLSDVLTQVRITTFGGTDTFDAGSINILYE
jgi:hypothetical protein